LNDEHVEQLLGAVDYVLDFHNWSRTVENAERAYRVLEANGELGRIAAQYAPALAPEGFTVRPDEDEFLRNGSLSEVAEYLKAKLRIATWGSYGASANRTGGSSEQARVIVELLHFEPEHLPLVCESIVNSLGCSRELADHILTVDLENPILWLFRQYAKVGVTIIISF
jgi:hypothetical protein